MCGSVCVINFEGIEIYILTVMLNTIMLRLKFISVSDSLLPSYCCGAGLGFAPPEHQAMDVTAELSAGLASGPLAFWLIPLVFVSGKTP